MQVKHFFLNVCDENHFWHNSRYSSEFHDLREFFNIFNFVSLGHTVQQTQIAHNRHTGSYELIISNLEENLSHHKWANEELPCLQKTLDILRNLKNHTLWATWVWDSMQSPTGVLYGTRSQFGNNEQCIHPPWIHTHPELRTQYCLAYITLTKKRQIKHEDPYTNANEYISSVSKYNLTFNKLTWGLCLPAVCKSNSIKQFAKTFLNNSHLGFALPETTISIDSCQSYNEKTEVSYGFYAAIAFIGSMILLTLFCTHYYEYHRYAKEQTYKILIAKAFSAVENTAELFKEKKGAISSVNSLKFLTACLVVNMHYSAICLKTGIRNSKSLDSLIERYSLHVFLHPDIFVDTFIMISGVLLMNNILSTDKPVTINNLIKRYFRLTYVPMVLILYITQLLKYHNSGPLLQTELLSDVEYCRNNWWTVLLNVNNYVDFRKACFPITWSNACDFHFTIIGTGLYWLYQKNRSLGLKAYIIGAIASVTLPTLVAFRLGLMPIDFSDLERFSDFTYYVITPTYLHSHLRSGPYFIGIAFGCLLSLYKPANYTKLSVKASTTILTLGVGLGMFITMLGGYLAHRNHSPFEAALYVGTNRTIWAIALGIVIVSFEYGYIPLISDFIHWRIFIPLSKLCFSLYLTHWLVIVMKTYNTMSPETLKFTYLAIDSLGVITFCCGLSYLLWLVFEAPMNNIVALVLLMRSRKEINNGTSQTNGDLSAVKKIT
ncbi:nose resistant to fluoxetine protein 6 [Bicyclus anynana]|uniref:Nose resistant to fluoxetine protein 6 n=1 Tax=Bicyclus anynana TaxID=110368 RepID=A0ABM3LX78_BICAN|nr:nose resistant to fluoxetine protein 6 [Bicyclus anynana]